MFKIIKIENCPEKTILNIKIMKILSKINPKDDFIITFIMDYEVKQIQAINGLLKDVRNQLGTKIKLTELNIDDSNSNECDGKERLALVLSNISSLKNSLKLITNVNDLNDIYNIYLVKSNCKVKRMTL